MKSKNGKTVAAYITRIADLLNELVRLEPTCIKCGCTEYSPCDDGLGEGCSWTFLNKKTNEALCSTCFADLLVRIK